MDIATLGYYIAIVPGTILGLAAAACIVLTLYTLIKMTIEEYKNKNYTGMFVCMLLWWLLIGIALIVIGGLT